MMDWNCIFEREGAIVLEAVVFLGKSQRYIHGVT